MISPKTVANFFFDTAMREGNLTVSPMKMQKLVYYAHGWHLGLADKPLIDEPVQAWPYGPVVPSLYQEFKHFGNGLITQPATDVRFVIDGEGATQLEVVAPRVVESAFSPDFMQKLMGKVWEIYRNYSAVQLSNETHKPGTPWDQIKARHGGRIPENTVIPNDMIRDYFRRAAAGGN
ncbi:MAG: DUF4065 domain-containing protein [Gemmataceae bacterium]